MPLTLLAGAATGQEEEGVEMLAAQCSSAGSPRNPNRSPARQHTPGPQPDLSSMTTLCRTA